jgi:hypothetical protein
MPTKEKWLSAVPAIIVMLAVCAMAGCATHTSQANSRETARPVATPAQLTGAELYAINCNRCHPERSAIERRPAEETTILTHMRVRANLPAAQARAILGYLRENDGS